MLTAALPVFIFLEPKMISMEIVTIALIFNIKNLRASATTVRSD